MVVEREINSNLFMVNGNYDLTMISPLTLIHAKFIGNHKFHFANILSRLQ